MSMTSVEINPRSVSNSLALRSIPGDYGPAAGFPQKGRTQMLHSKFLMRIVKIVGPLAKDC
jgi:hypothetical protein